MFYETNLGHYLIVLSLSVDVPVL